MALLFSLESTGDLLLSGIAAVSQKHHGKGLGHNIFGVVMMHGEPSHDNDTEFTFGAQ
jgi:hypothetical protein